MKNNFDNWFSKQFGRLPMSHVKFNNLIYKKDSLKRELNSFELALEGEISLRKQYQAAHYAKNKYEK